MSLQNITTVQLRNDEGVKVITLEQMTKEFYNENHDDIYCPNPECDAHISYCSGDKIKAYFRTFKSSIEGDDIIEQHIEGCSYGVEHDTVLKERIKYDPSIQVGLTDEHVKRALSYAFHKQKDKDSDTPKSTGNTKPRNKTKSSLNKDNGKVLVQGKLSLTADSPAEEVKARDAALRHKNINDVDVNDYGLARVILGEIQGVLFDENKFCTIVLKMNDDRNGRVYFGEQFRVDHETQFNQLNAYATYFEKYNTDEKMYGAFIGEVKEDEFGISVYVRQPRSVRIDELSHYELLRKLNQQRIS